jgi:UDP-glucose 4-epimerase
MRWRICAPAASPRRSIAASGHGFSVFEKIETVKRVSGADSGTSSPTGGRATRYESSRLPSARSALKWQPHFGDLQTIVTHALACKRKLSARQLMMLARPFRVRQV